MAPDLPSAGKGFGRRLEKWARDSTELRALWDSARGVPAAPEEKALRRYHRSSKSEVALPHPAITQRRYEALSQRNRELGWRMSLALLAIPLLVALGVVVGPQVALAVQVAIWALVVPVTGLVVHDVRAREAVNTERRMALKGGLAEAWGDWVAAREKLDSIEGASQARTALATNEPRMQALVLALARAESRPNHRDTAEHAESREWVYRSAAKAKALAEAEQELDDATQSHVDAGDLELAPDGDLEALDHALDTARELTRGVDDPR